MSEAARKPRALESRAGQQLAAKGEMKPFYILSSHPCSFSLRFPAIPQAPARLPGPRTGCMRAAGLLCSTHRPSPATLLLGNVTLLPRLFTVKILLQACGRLACFFFFFFLETEFHKKMNSFKENVGLGCAGPPLCACTGGPAALLELTTCLGRLLA